MKQIYLVQITQDNIPVVLLFHLSPVSDVEAISVLLKRFLGLEELQRRQQQEEEAAYGEDEVDSMDSSGSDGEAGEL